MKKFVCSALVVLTASSLAHADGLYAGVNISPSEDGHVSYTEKGVTTQHNAVQKQTPFAVFAGYDLSPDWALEGGYRGSGGSTSFDIMPGYQLKVRTSAAYLAARGTWKLNDDWSLFGKAGLARSSLKLDIRGQNAPPDQSMNKTGLYLSAGASYVVSKDVALQVELERIGKLNYEGLSVGLNRLALGVRFGF
ncbi:porin family protein [Rugamonas aquatica]|uniref:Outer membrane beta-barrel protein n=1 Tax=Rugamonas aquatica TaxID=2743357 RepID=A0A6A7N817_9BURK|nr:porin family protein [Rugamonas aquatica]MQA41169.1 outer membrane beta-barrel protein [Rugamonas aquatica]